MRIVIAGGHGKIALHLQQLLSSRGDEAVGLIRKPDQADDLRQVGGQPVVVDLESSTVEEVASQLEGADAAVFAAGAGPGSGPERKLTVDRDSAILLADACVSAGVRRLLVVSSIGADNPAAVGDEVFRVYLQAKAAADAYVRASGLDWTIVRPGSLTNDPPTGLVTAAEKVQRGSIPRADVAAVLVASLDIPASIGKQFEARQW